MFRSKKWKLLVSGSLALALLTALFGIRHRTGPRANEDPLRALEGHRFPVQALAFSPDGDTLTSAAHYLLSPDGTEVPVEVAVWEAGSGKRIRKRLEHPGAVLAVAFAPGGQTLATAVEGRALVLWDVTPWCERRRLEGDRSPGHALAFADDGSRLAAANCDNSLTLWDVDGSRPKACGAGHTGRVFSLAFAPGGAVLASGGGDKTVRLWDGATGEERATLRGHAGAVVALAFSPDGRALATGDHTGVVKL
jgi:WD40 repeat protein